VSPRSARGLLVAVAIAALGVAAPAGAAALGYQSLLSMESQFMCVSCHEPLQLVSSPQALAEKGVLRSLIAKHDTASQIRSAMVSNYGVEVLAKPPASGFNLTVYILPPALLLAGIAALLYSLPRWRERARLAAVTPLEGAAPLGPDDARRLDDELAHFID
jgi:cytochrome c-type biogenesis protein CcmH